MANFKSMTESQKLEHWKAKHAEVTTEWKHYAKWWGERLGIQAELDRIAKKLRNIEFQIERCQFNEHVQGNCDPATCSDCQTNSYCPTKWPVRGCKLDVQYTRS